MRNYSYAPAGSGVTDPNGVWEVNVDEDACPEGKCPEDGVHLVMIWTGEEYSRRNAWISASDDSFTELEEMR